jgi:hypothetical protein
VLWRLRREADTACGILIHSFLRNLNQSIRMPIANAAIVVSNWMVFQKQESSHESLCTSEILPAM